MEYAIYQFPSYVQEVIDKLIETDWFIHSYSLSHKSQVYDPCSYLFNAERHGTSYTVHLDLNIYQYVLGIFKKKAKNDLHRHAAALMVFGKLTNIKFDPTIAVYERINYKEECPDEIIDDLMLFRRIDNSNMDSLAKFALGDADSFELPPVSNIDEAELKHDLTKFKRLKKWDILYLMVLKVTELYYFNRSSNENKNKAFWDWCHSDFMYSLIATSFAIKLFGKQQNQRLMKYRPGLTETENKKHLVNMTWDLFLLDKFFENWKKKKSNEEFIYASNDKPLKQVLNAAITMQLSGAAELCNDLSPRLIDEFNNISERMSETKGRKIIDTKDFKTFRDQLIREQEQILL